MDDETVTRSLVILGCVLDNQPHTARQYIRMMTESERKRLREAVRELGCLVAETDGEKRP